MILSATLITLALLLLCYYSFFGFYNYLYACASFFKPGFKKVHISGKKVAVVIVSFNEEHVIADTIKQCEKLSYKNKVIIVGDDSTDGRTYPLLEKIARAKGCKRSTDPKLTGNGTRDVWESPSFVLFHRRTNNGFKAGNLKELEVFLKARELEYMYLLDADWWPQKDALERCLEVLEADEQLAFVQTKRVSYHGKMDLWERCLALGEDGCYFADLAGRQAVGDTILFTGCCTLFRMDAIYKAEGFRPGHLTEDIDLTNRFYLLGYKAAFLESVSNEGEVPPHYHAYRRQQERWTMGTARTLKEYFVPIMTSKKLRIREKLSLLRQNAYYTGALAVELSIILALCSVLLLSARESVEAAQFRYYFQFIGVAYSTIIITMLCSNFAAPLVVTLKRRVWDNILYAPLSTWLSWSLLHTYFIANIKGFFNIKRDWFVTPKGMRKKVQHHSAHTHHIRLINLITLILLIVTYSIEWVEFGTVDPFAFFWIPALATGVFLS